ncbi:MAG: hypothetical protein EHM19_04210 [Candidatus Latescibacterota bacterium]|nr:MAG: hypothetical protein EHM19_04210 [Candidatus Latescibacterota bacterium]
MRKPASVESMFVVARRRTPPDIIDWAIEHPTVIADRFEVLATWIPLPDGGEIPILGSTGDGSVRVVDRLEEETATFYRQGRIVSFLRSRTDWLQRAFPERHLDPGRGLHLILLGEDFTPSFIDAMAGLALSELVLLRVRDLESADGKRIVLVERERSRMKLFDTVSSPRALASEEEEFFRRLEEEREGLRPQEEAG